MKPHNTSLVREGINKLVEVLGSKKEDNKN